MKIALLALATAGALSALPVAARPAQSHQSNNQNQKFNYGYDQNHQVTPQERANWQAQHAANRATGNNNRGNNGNNQGNYNNRNNGNNNRGNYGNNGNGNSNNGNGNNGNGNTSNNNNGNNGNGNPNLVNRILQQTQPSGNN